MPSSDLSILQLYTVDEYRREEIAEAVSGLFSDELTGNEFSTELEHLSKCLGNNLLDYFLTCDIESEVDLVTVYFECYNWVLKFEYNLKGKFAHCIFEITVHN